MDQVPGPKGQGLSSSTLLRHLGKSASKGELLLAKEGESISIPWVSPWLSPHRALEDGLVGLEESIGLITKVSPVLLPAVTQGSQTPLPSLEQCLHTSSQAR